MHGQGVGVGSVFMERKFLRGLGVVGHIEDIAVDKKMQGHKLGLRIIQALTAISEGQGAYKTILNCSTENIREYLLFSREAARIWVWYVFASLNSFLQKVWVRGERTWDGKFHFSALNAS